MIRTFACAHVLCAGGGVAAGARAGVYVHVGALTSARARAGIHVHMRACGGIPLVAEGGGTLAGNRG